MQDMQVAEMKRNVTPEKADSFPLLVRKGSATVKIYEVKNRDAKNYTVSYLTAVNGRVRKTFADLDTAKREANTIALNLAHGDLQALKLTGAERQVYVEATRMLARSGVGLNSAACEFARAFDILGHAGIVEACRYYKKHVETSLDDVTVADAVAKFTEAKKAEGMSALYLKDIRGYLGRFAQHFQCNLATIPPEDLRAYLGALKVGPVAKNNHRRLMVALFNFAKGEGWLHADQKTAAERLGAYKVKEREVEIFTPAEVAKLLAHAEEDFLPWIVLIAFCGVRNEELKKGLGWHSINFSQGYMLVTADIAKTNRKRKIDLPENALAWLRPYRARQGAIFDRDFRKPLARACKAARVTYKRNALRHSFGSYRMELVKNAGQVALEMGNSAAIVMRHYFDIVEKNAAQTYFDIRPVSRGDRKIVALA
jgi:integrase